MSFAPGIAAPRNSTPGRPDRETGDPPSLDLRMFAPRSPLPPMGRNLLIVAAVLGTLVGLRFLLIGAWPVLLFAVLDFGALFVAMHLFNRAPVPEERLCVRRHDVELIRSDHRGRKSRVALPTFWTRLEASGRSGIDHDLWLVFRNKRHAIGRCLSAEERRLLEPRIRAALASARG